MIGAISNRIYYTPKEASQAWLWATRRNCDVGEAGPHLKDSFYSKYRGYFCNVWKFNDPSKFPFCRGIGSSPTEAVVDAWQLLGRPDWKEL